jgi:hypothetical protein
MKINNKQKNELSTGSGEKGVITGNEEKTRKIVSSGYLTNLVKKVEWN